MFRARHVLNEFLYTVYTLARVAVPCQCRCGTVELWQVIRTGGRVVGGVVQAGELICGPRRYINTEGGVSRDSNGLVWTLNVLVAGERGGHCEGWSRAV